MTLSDIISLRFDYYTDIRFWISFLIAVFLFRLVSANRYVRNIALVLFNIAFLFALPRFTFKIFLFMSCITLLTYLAGVFLNKSKFVINRMRLAILSNGFVVGVLLFFKYGFIQKIFFQNVLQRPYEASDFIFLIGISYSSFKMICGLSRIFVRLKLLRLPRLVMQRNVKSLLN